MANEAYRAVFLRVHPTGKMVLSLTTDSDGREAEYAQLVAGELGVPPLDVKVVPADTDRFGNGHGFNTSPSDGTPAAITSATAQDPRQGEAARRHGARGVARVADVVERRVGGRRELQDDRGHRALRARLRPAAAGRGGRARRADRLQRLRRRASISTRTSSATLSAPNRAVYGFMPQSVCLTTAPPLTRPSSSARSNVIGRVVPTSVRSPVRPARRRRLDRRSSGS